MKQKRVFLMCGVPGSGKSSWVRLRVNTYGGYHISRDEIRFAILNERGGDYFDYENEVIRTFVAKINELLDSDEQCIDIYVDATHLTDNSRNQIMRQLHLEDAYKIAVWMKVPLEICKVRNDMRTGRAKVPHKAIAEMYLRARRPSPKAYDEIWEINSEGERIN